MIDPFGRTISYLRLSVTDRCNFRCTYCMPAAMRFAPRSELLDLDELDRVATAFVRNGIRKIRLTGGEPLARPGIIGLVAALSRHLDSGTLDELVLTTNGTMLRQHAAALAAHGVRRINVSLDTLDPDLFSRLTRGGRLAEVIDGIDAAIGAGIAIKLNVVVLRHDNLEESVSLAEWAHRRAMTISFIEVMPLGEVDADRFDQHVPMTAVRERLERRWILSDLALTTGGPSRYVRTDQGGTIGFITPLSRNFCEGCNRVRVDSTGKLFACLGHEEAFDLSTILRAGTDGALDDVIARAVGRKPRAHDFRIAAGEISGPARHMSVTGG